MHYLNCRFHFICYCIKFPLASGKMGRSKSKSSSKDKARDRDKDTESSESKSADLKIKEMLKELHQLVKDVQVRNRSKN